MDYNRYKDELVLLRQVKYTEGSTVYGELRFLQREPEDLLMEVKEEIADTMNWLELLYVKLRLMEEEL